jgi:1A family penicillin-binding protein
LLNFPDRTGRIWRRALPLGWLLALAAVASAQDPIASFPPQPSGVSAITVLDREGRYLGRILPQKRYWVPLDQIPIFLQKALVAVEDARFYDHGAIDLRGIARALVKDAIKGKVVEGGSTITQQLIKNRYLNGAVTLDRKVKEARMAMAFERQYSKQQILEMYFNEIYYGNGAEGLVQAAMLYFNKRPEQLTPAECAQLAGVPKNPSRYNPLGKPADVAGRRDLVLKRMVDLGIITPAQRQEIWAAPAAVQKPGQAPHYLAQVRAQLEARFGPEVIEQGGLEVATALDLNLQHEAEQALNAGVGRLAPGLQGALICLDPATGDVLAAVGGVGAVGSTPNGINRAFFAQRQPGSAIKPLLYASAVEQGITAGSIWSDAPASYDRGNGTQWQPHNDNHEHFGNLSLHQALAHSDNIISVKVLDRVGVPYFTAFAARMGVALKAQDGLSLALGSDVVTLSELVQAYTPLATGGNRAVARTIVRIYDRRKGTWTDNPPVVAPELSPGAAYITTRMMTDVMTYGTAKGLRKFNETYPSAGKTGTTDAGYDAWFVGYTPQLIAGVWVGYDQPRSGGRGFTGGAVAAPIWERFMRKALAGRPVVDFPKPDSVVGVMIDPATGNLAAPGATNALNEFYLKGTEPTAEGANPGAVPPVQAPPAPAAPAPEPEAAAEPVS